MRRSSYVLILIAAAMLVIAGCSDTLSQPAASDSSTMVVATTALPSATTTVTPPAPAHSPAAPSASPTAPPATRVDGTVSPLNFGATDPVTIKANPDPPGATGILAGVRIGVHPEEGGWERLVFEFRDMLPAGSVAYVSEARMCGSGMPVSLSGGALLLVRFTGAVAHNEAGQLTISSTSVTGPGRTILQMRQVCDFEGEVAWAVGVSGRQRFKLTLLDGPRRVVIDIRS